MKGQKGPLIVLEYLRGKGGGMNSAHYQEQVLDGVFKGFFCENGIREASAKISAG